MMLIVYDILTIAFLLFGLFFFFVGALGVYRMPDVYGRMHAASKCVTLGICGILLAVIFHLAGREDAPLFEVATKVLLVVIFQFVANPIGAHILSHAAHLEHAAMYPGTLADEEAEDEMAEARGEAPPSERALTTRSPESPDDLS